MPLAAGRFDLLLILAGMVFCSVVLVTASAVADDSDAAATETDPLAENRIFQQLVEIGVPLSEADRVRLPRPSLPDGLDAPAQQEVLRRVAAPRRTVDQLVRKSVVSPFVLDIRTLDKPTGDTRGRTIDLWFVAYGSLDDLADREFLEQLARASGEDGGDLPSKWHLLEEPELASRGIELAPLQSTKEIVFHSTFPLLDRVLIRATRRAMVTQTEESILLAAELDPRFVDDPDYPNCWQPIELDNLGRPKVGPATSYVSAGFYLKATALKAPPGALWIEYHQAYAEPRGWFRGANLLRSKLPLIVQDAVRKFRRKIDR